MKRAQSSLAQAEELRETMVQFYRTHIRQRRTGLSLTQITVLGIAERGDMNAAKLATLLNVRRSTMSVIVNRLEEQELVCRRVDENDLRVSRIQVTPKGAALLSEVRSRSNLYIAGLLEGLTAEDRATLRDAAKILQKLLPEQPPS